MTCFQASECCTSTGCHVCSPRPRAFLGQDRRPASGGGKHRAPRYDFSKWSQPLCRSVLIRHMKRKIEPRTRQLTFEIPNSTGRRRWVFRTHETIRRVEVGYEINTEFEEDRERPRRSQIQRYLERFCPESQVARIVRGILRWASKLELNLVKLYVQFVREAMFGGGFQGRAITGMRRRALW